jgi:hypothetical protein
MKTNGIPISAMRSASQHLEQAQAPPAKARVLQSRAPASPRSVRQPQRCSAVRAQSTSGLVHPNNKARLRSTLPRGAAPWEGCTADQATDRLGGHTQRGASRRQAPFPTHRIRRAVEHDALVRDQPARGVLREQRHDVAGTDAQPAQPRGKLELLREELPVTPKHTASEMNKIRLVLFEDYDFWTLFGSHT